MLSQLYVWLTVATGEFLRSPERSCSGQRLFGVAAYVDGTAQLDRQQRQRSSLGMFPLDLLGVSPSLGATTFAQQSRLAEGPLQVRVTANVRPLGETP